MNSNFLTNKSIRAQSNPAKITLISSFKAYSDLNNEIPSLKKMINQPKYDKEYFADFNK